MVPVWSVQVAAAAKGMCTDLVEYMLCELCFEMLCMFLALDAIRYQYMLHIHVCCRYLLLRLLFGYKCLDTKHGRS